MYIISFFRSVQGTRLPRKSCTVSNLQKYQNPSQKETSLIWLWNRDPSDAKNKSAINILPHSTLKHRHLLHFPFKASKFLSQYLHRKLPMTFASMSKNSLYHFFIWKNEKFPKFQKKKKSTIVFKTDDAPSQGWISFHIWIPFYQFWNFRYIFIMTFQSNPPF